jgi:hypothetical protein
VADGEAAGGASDFDAAAGDFGAGVWAKVFVAKKMPINAGHANLNIARLEAQFRNWAKFSNPNVEIRNNGNRNQRNERNRVHIRHLVLFTIAVLMFWICFEIRISDFPT